jgi:hypothetical protein
MNKLDKDGTKFKKYVERKTHRKNITNHYSQQITRKYVIAEVKEQRKLLSNDKGKPNIIVKVLLRLKNQD